MKARRSFWAWGLESDEPTLEQRRQTAEALSKQFGVPIQVPPMPRSSDLHLRPPRITPPDSLAAICTTDTHDRAVHTYGRSFPDGVRAFTRQFPTPPDVVAYPRHEQEVAAVLEWCSVAG